MLRDKKNARQTGSPATEDSMLVFRMGTKVKFVPGDVENIKITWPVDLLVAKAMLFQEWEIW